MSIACTQQHIGQVHSVQHEESVPGVRWVSPELVQTGQGDWAVYHEPTTPKGIDWSSKVALNASPPIKFSSSCTGSTW
jgi:hypothetical protein